MLALALRGLPLRCRHLPVHRHQHTKTGRLTGVGVGIGIAILMKMFVVHVIWCHLEDNC